jgi:hypothetical protein
VALTGAAGRKQKGLPFTGNGRPWKEERVIPGSGDYFWTAVAGAAAGFAAG